MKITLHSPLDMHLHLREGEMLKRVTTFTTRQFAGAVIMPNLVSPVDSLAKLQAYRKAVVNCAGDTSFMPYMTLFFRNYSRKELSEAKEHIIGLKLYPAGVTTQSEKGISDFTALNPTLDSMQELGIPLLVHGETSGFVMDREEEFLDISTHIAQNFPKLHMIMEHITTEASVRFLEKYDNVSATVTLHHLLLTLDDVAGGLLRPDLFCKPIAKRPSDREALREAVFSGNRKIMFGSDSAPHPRHHKECLGCAAGIFSAPVALPLLAQIFAEANCLHLLQGFICDHAKERYTIDPPAKPVTLEEKSWKVPSLYENVIPFFAGKEIQWSLVSEG